MQDLVEAQPHAPVAPRGLAVNDELQVDAAGTAGTAVATVAGDPPTSEAPPTQLQQQQTPRTMSAARPASTATSEALPLDESREDDGEALQETDVANDAQPQLQPQSQSRQASPVARPAMSMSSSASSQSLGLIAIDASESLDGPATSALLATPTSPVSRSSTPPAPPPVRDPSTQRPKGTLVLRTSPPSPQPYASHRPTVTSSLDDLPNEVLMHILGYLDVNDLLATSRTSHHLRCLAVAPILHTLRRRQIRATLPPLLSSPMRPSLTDLIRRHIFLTSTTVVSRKLTRSLVSIRLSRRLAARPPVHVLVERCVLPPECAPGIGHVAPALAARTRAVEREKLKDGLRRWVGAVWQREVGRRSERIRICDESLGVGKVWRLRKFWERVSHGNGNEI
ncbi:hypothetical protein SBRCBS47491_009252 [Sporothrix bragantina]|uniref:F-box domain-containing protein n=1 Tax=Sporothrix bragantina TaxID=671064 RepID=A0ABP0CTS3_9PEZI